MMQSENRPYHLVRYAKPGESPDGVRVSIRKLASRVPFSPHYDTPASALSILSVAGHCADIQVAWITAKRGITMMADVDVLTCGDRTISQAPRKSVRGPISTLVPHPSVPVHLVYGPCPDPAVTGFVDLGPKIRWMRAPTSRLEHVINVMSKPEHVNNGFSPWWMP